jgi:hypothetical protein
MGDKKEIMLAILLSRCKCEKWYSSMIAAMTIVGLTYKVRKEK